jgi:hypothetical protein
MAFVLTGAGCGADPGSAPDATVAPTLHAPIGFTFEAIEDRSFASFGWSGLIHNVRVPDGTPFGVKVTHCDPADSRTGICTFEGPVPPVGQSAKVNRRRCLNHMSISCTRDDECMGDPAPQRCVFIYDPPAANPLVGVGGKVGACGWSYIPVNAMAPTITGTLDLTSGELNLQSLTITLANNGVNGTYRGACAECIGDNGDNDGVKNGTCMPATHGQASDPSPDVPISRKCDVNRTGTIEGFDGTYSMDCAPTAKAVDGPGSSFGGTFTSSGYQVSITSASPDCSDPKFAGQKCFCGMCADGVRACMSSAECGGGPCSGVAPINCSPNPPPYNDDGTANLEYDPTLAIAQCRNPDPAIRLLSATRPNSCRDGGACKWDAARGIGTCTSLINYRSDVGCYPGGMGATIVAPGSTGRIGDVYYADTANARCTRLQPSPAINGQLGLPGLTFQRRAFRIIPEFAP